MESWKTKKKENGNSRNSTASGPVITMGHTHAVGILIHHPSPFSRV